MASTIDKQGWDTVAIVGVGLLGASIGLALRSRGLARSIIGVGRSAASLQTALELQAIDTAHTDLASGVLEAELTIFCTPVGLIADQVCEAAPHAPAGALFTDAGSTKQALCEQIAAAEDSQGVLAGGVRFIGSHPLAGGEQSGPAAGRADLFVGRKVIVTPTGNHREQDVARIASFWESLGAAVERMAPEHHDQALAAVSHVPHMIAALLANETDDRHLSLASTGWLDTTRIAAGDVEMWKQIVAANRGNIVEALLHFEGSLAALREAIELDHHHKLEKILADARSKRQAVGN